ncbi:hypothetical protein ACFOLC_11285 [Lysobacter cavernae]|uniref:Uncharacterized protein n=1 Tax=Lysobacter cavernae TaxID=1685901 RepID=A0ABV7RUL3_9GAMM
MVERSSANAMQGLPEAISIASGIKGFVLWIGGSLAGMTAILYVCGYLITTAHIYALGLYGLVDFSKDYFLLEGAKFFLSIVIGIAQVAVSPLVILVTAAAIPFALIAVLTRRKLLQHGQRLRDMYEAHATTTWAIVARLSLYCVLLVASAMIAFDSLRAISFHLQISGLLYSNPGTLHCQADLIALREAFLCGRFDVLRSVFNAQLWSAVQLVVMCCIGWHVVSRWHWRAWLIGPLLFVTALLVLMLPMEFGALLKPSRYPVVRIETKDARAPPIATGQFLIDRNERGLTVWDPPTRRVLWIPSDDVARMETVGIRELFEAPAGR